MIALVEKLPMRNSFLRSCAAMLMAAIVASPSLGDDSGKLVAGKMAPAFAPKGVLRGETPDLKTETGCVVLHFLVSNEAPSKKSITVLNRLNEELGPIGLQVMAVFDEDPRDVQPFLKSGSGAPNYRVAADRDGTSRRDWVGAAEIKTLPQAFIVGRGGKILWIGSPLDSGFEACVRKAMTGRFDPAARERIDPALKAGMKCAEVRNWGEAYKHFDEAIEVDPVMALDAVAERYKTTLLREGKPEAANAWLVQTAKKRYATDVMAMTDVVNLLLKDPEVKPRSPATAEEIVAASTVKTGPWILALKAQVASAKGDIAKAVELQTDAWMSALPIDKPGFKRALEEYRAASKRQQAGGAEVKRGS